MRRKTTKIFSIFTKNYLNIKGKYKEEEDGSAVRKAGEDD
jgi:hypothetical protein